MLKTIVQRQYTLDDSGGVGYKMVYEANDLQKKNYVFLFYLIKINHPSHTSLNFVYILRHSSLIIENRKLIKFDKLTHNR